MLGHVLALAKQVCKITQHAAPTLAFTGRNHKASENTRHTSTICLVVTHSRLETTKYFPLPVEAGRAPNPTPRCLVGVGDPSEHSPIKLFSPHFDEEER